MCIRDSHQSGGEQRNISHQQHTDKQHDIERNGFLDKRLYLTPGDAAGDKYQGTHGRRHAAAGHCEYIYHGKVDGVDAVSLSHRSQKGNQNNKGCISLNEHAHHNEEQDNDKEEQVFIVDEMCIRDRAPGGLHDGPQPD